MAQMTRTARKGVLLWLSLILRPIQGVKQRQTPNFGGVNRRYPAECAEQRC